MATLTEITDDLQALSDLLHEMGGDVTEADAEAAIDAWLQETGDALASKVDGYCGLIRECEARADFRKREGDRLCNLASTDANLAKRLKERLMYHLAALEMPKLETPRYRVAIQANGGKAPVRLLCEPDAIPEEYTTTVVTKKVNTDQIREELEQGAALSFAELGAKGTHLRIR